MPAVLSSCPGLLRSGNADLGSLTIGSDVTDYAATVAPSVSELTVAATAADPEASIRVRANAGDWLAASSGSSSPALSLESGSNSVEVEVTAENLDTTTYTIAVERVTPGSIDASFDTGSAVTPVVSGGMWPIALQADGKALIAGCFTSFDGTARSNLARLNQDGSLDTSFDPGGTAGTGGQYELADALVLQPDGKVLIGGSFWLNYSLPNIVARVWGD